MAGKETKSKPKVPAKAQKPKVNPSMALLASLSGGGNTAEPEAVVTPHAEESVTVSEKIAKLQPTIDPKADRSGFKVIGVTFFENDQALIRKVGRAIEEQAHGLGQLQVLNVSKFVRLGLRELQEVFVVDPDRALKLLLKCSVPRKKKGGDESQKVSASGVSVTFDDELKLRKLMRDFEEFSLEKGQFLKVNVSQVIRTGLLVVQELHETNMDTLLRLAKEDDEIFKRVSKRGHHPR